MPRGKMEGIAQQIDIMPTVLGYLGYQQPYIAFGCDLFHTAAEDTWAVNYQNGIYQYVKGDYLIQFDGKELKAVYRFKEDKVLENNLVNEIDSLLLIDELKAIIQSYMYRMNNNRLLVEQ
jgi:phosphoglycerol transferase MdoB-like AlkP superfamily enzyme